jgi:hypothetical protein
VLTLDGYRHCGQPIVLTEFGGIAYVKQPRGQPSPAKKDLR